MNGFFYVTFLSPTQLRTWRSDDKSHPCSWHVLNGNSRQRRNTYRRIVRALELQGLEYRKRPEDFLRK